MTWDGARYTRAGVTAAQASSSTHTALAAEAPAVVDGQLRQSLRLSTGQILRVRVRRYLAAVDALAAAYGVRVVDVASELYEAIRARAEHDDVDWDVVLRTDGHRRRGAPPSAEWPYLRALVHDAFEEWWAPLGAEPTPLLLTNAGVLARYELLHHISTLLDQASVRPAARWVLVPRRDGQRVPMLDGEQVPLGAARWIELPEDLESLKTGDVT